MFVLYALVQGHSGQGDPLRQVHRSLRAVSDERVKQFVKEDGTLNDPALLAQMEVYLACT